MTTTHEPGLRPKAGARPTEHVSTANLRAEGARSPEHAAARTRTRLRRGDDIVDEFFIPIEEIPDGLSYEWKCFSVHGQEDPFYLARMREQGWEPVPPSRHPTWVPPGYNAPHIIKGGQILMDRPMELTIDARNESYNNAIKQIREAEQRLGKTNPGEMTRDYDGARPKIVKEVGRMVPMTVDET